MVVIKNIFNEKIINDNCFFVSFWTVIEEKAEVAMAVLPYLLQTKQKKNKEYIFIEFIDVSLIFFPMYANLQL